MSKRTLRRAAERIALKAERKNQLPQLLAEIPKTIAATASIHDFNRRRLPTSKTPRKTPTPRPMHASPPTAPTRKKVQDPPQFKVAPNLP